MLCLRECGPEPNGNATTEVAQGRRSDAPTRRFTFGLPDLNRPLSLLLAAASIPVLLFADWIAYNAADIARERRKSSAPMTRSIVSASGSQKK